MYCKAKKFSIEIIKNWLLGFAAYKEARQQHRNLLKFHQNEEPDTYYQSWCDYYQECFYKALNGEIK